jgi:hypothetical protein
MMQRQLMWQNCQHRERETSDNNHGKGDKVKLTDKQYEALL